MSAVVNKFEARWANSSLPGKWAATGGLSAGMRLVVLLGTARAHINSIYGKLGVHSRVEAVARARALVLLPALFEAHIDLPADPAGAVSEAAAPGPGRQACAASLFSVQPSKIAS